MNLLISCGFSVLRQFLVLLIGGLITFCIIILVRKRSMDGKHFNYSQKVLVLVLLMLIWFDIFFYITRWDRLEENNGVIVFSFSICSIFTDSIVTEFTGFSQTLEERLQMLFVYKMVIRTITVIISERTKHSKNGRIQMFILQPKQPRPPSIR